jgi:hypothetical protein
MNTLTKTIIGEFTRPCDLCSEEPCDPCVEEASRIERVVREQIARDIEGMRPPESGAGEWWVRGYMAGTVGAAAVARGRRP